MLFLVTLSAIFISKLAIEPLFDYIKELQHLSKETLHELKLPLSTIMLNLNMLKKKEVDEKNLKRLKRIEDACSMIEKRYNELDYMIKKQSNEEIYEEFNLKELILQRVEFLKELYPHINFNLTLNDLNIKNDKVGLSKVIDNLIDNAIKYSNGSTNIDIILKDNSLYIKDYGIGIDEVELLKIFDRYYQTNKSVEGFGIGLNIVKNFCDKNKIELNLKSKVDVGTTVILKFKEK